MTPRNFLRARRIISWLRLCRDPALISEALKVKRDMKLGLIAKAPTFSISPRAVLSHRAEARELKEISYLLPRLCGGRSRWPIA